MSCQLDKDLQLTEFLGFIYLVSFLIVLKELYDIVHVILLILSRHPHLFKSNEEATGLVAQNSATEVLELLTSDLVWHCFQVQNLPVGLAFLGFGRFVVHLKVDAHLPRCRLKSPFVLHVAEHLVTVRVEHDSIVQSHRSGLEGPVFEVIGFERICPRDDRVVPVALLLRKCHIGH